MRHLLINAPSSRYLAFRGATTADAMSAILNSDPPEIAGVGATVPTALDRQIRRCLEKDPQDRFQSARDLGFALQTIPPGSSDALSALSGRRSSSRPRNGDRCRAGDCRGYGVVALERSPTRLHLAFSPASTFTGR
jgi:serine/threonine protein kinase